MVYSLHLARSTCTGFLSISGSLDYIGLLFVLDPFVSGIKHRGDAPSMPPDKARGHQDPQDLASERIGLSETS